MKLNKNITQASLRYTLDRSLAIMVSTIDDDEDGQLITILCSMEAVLALSG